MNEKISYIKLPNITTSKLQDVVDFLEDNEIEYVEYYAEDLQNRIDKAIELIKNKISTETYQHLKVLYDDIDKIEEVWEDYEFDDLLDVLKESGE